MSAHIQDGIGGSDVAAIMDLYRDPEEPRLDPFKTALQLYERITSGEPGTAKPISFRAKMGQIVEPLIFKEYCERHNWKRNLFRRNVEMTIEGFPHFRGELDAVSRKMDLGVDCKLVGRYAQQFYGEEQTDSMPANYLLQLAWYRILSGVSLMHLACWMDSEKEGEHYKEYIYEPDSELEATLRYVTDKFWQDHIEARVPPVVQYASDSKTIARIFPKQTLDLREATAAEVELVECIQRMKRDKGKLDEGLALAEGELKRLIGLHEGLTLPGGAKVTWKANKTGEKTDWKLVAEKAGASADLIAECTQPKPGARPLIVPKLKD